MGSLLPIICVCMCTRVHAHMRSYSCQRAAVLTSVSFFSYTDCANLGCVFQNSGV